MAWPSSDVAVMICCMSNEICAQLWCALCCWDSVIGFSRFIHPYSLGLLHWHWENRRMTLKDVGKSTITITKPQNATKYELWLYCQVPLYGPVLHNKVDPYDSFDPKHVWFQVMNRHAFGKALAQQATIQSDIAKSRIEIEECRLLVLKAAHMMDTIGKKVRSMARFIWKMEVCESFCTVI